MNPSKIDSVTSLKLQTTLMDYSTKTREELITLCKEKGIKGYSGKNREHIISLVNEPTQTQDTGKFRTNMKDQFYTNETVAKLCIHRIVERLPFTKDYLWIEPSAGNGSFLRNVSFESIGLDIDPKGQDIDPKGQVIQKQNYLTWIPPNRDSIVFGNPPFGRQSSLAKAFISKSCEFAKVIAFILPKSFTKPSMFNAFGRKFHLLQSVDLEKNSFVLNDTPYDVPCVFQIWQKLDEDRPIEEKIHPKGFDYVSHNENYHIAFRRVGGLAGKCYKNNGTKYSIQSHNFIKFHDCNLSYIDTIIEKINNHTFPSNTLGPRSLSKTEANLVMNQIIQSIS
jgi:hypothetical protein